MQSNSVAYDAEMGMSVISLYAESTRARVSKGSALQAEGPCNKQLGHIRSTQ